MELRINIQADNDSFHDDREEELARILRRITRWLEAGDDLSHFLTLFDINGNDVGRVALKEDFS